MMKVEDENGVTYEGYCVDLIKKIADDLKFQYKIKEVDDGSYGRKTDLGEWNGMIRELIDGVRYKWFHKGPLEALAREETPRGKYPIVNRFKEI